MKVVYLAPEGFDYLSNQITEGLFALSLSGEIDYFMCTNKCVHHGSKIDDLYLAEDHEAERACDDADLIIVSSGGDYSFNEGSSGRILNSGDYKNRLVFLDGHDSNAYLIDPKNVKVYFKRELRYPDAASISDGNVRSLTFGIYQFLIDDPPPPPSRAAFDERDIDVSFMAFSGSNGLRRQCADVLNSIQDMNVSVTISDDCQPVPMESYREIMRRSKVGISIIGSGLDTLRFWETMGHGAVLCSINIANQLCAPLPEPNRQALYFDSWNRMLEQCRKVVSNWQQWAAIRRAADSSIQFHSTKSRARRLIEIFRELG